LCVGNGEKTAMAIRGSGFSMGGAAPLVLKGGGCRRKGFFLG